ncbi:major capsid protein [Roseibium alexandrii]|uniref:major capsid protein n=1 Tax=Roseibium alexandrii TaxID=388408 RepID=UPI003753BD5F
MLDIFKQDAFSVTSLTDAMREIKYVPSYIGSLGLFSEISVDTLTVAIEKDKEQNVFLIQSSSRGGPGQTFGKNKRSMRELRVPHFQVDDAIYADEVQAVRQFGTEAAVERLQGKIANRGAEISQSFALTEEYHRLKLITEGQLLDADGSVIYDFFTEMGESKPAPVDFDLDNSNPARGALREKCDDVFRAMGATLDGLPFTGITAICGDDFFKELVKHKEVYDIYLAMTGANTARLARGTVSATSSAAANSWGSFEYGNINFVNYRGGQSVGVDANKVHFVPQGVPGLFRTVYSPADYIETVNRPGQRMYAKQWEMQNGKGVNLEYQTNVLHYCTRPRVLMSGTLT